MARLIPQGTNKTPLPTLAIHTPRISEEFPAVWVELDVGRRGNNNKAIATTTLQTIPQFCRLFLPILIVLHLTFSRFSFSYAFPRFQLLWVTQKILPSIQPRQFSSP